MFSFLLLSDATHAQARTARHRNIHIPPEIIKVYKDGLVRMG